MRTAASKMQISVKCDITQYSTLALSRDVVLAIGGSKFNIIYTNVLQTVNGNVKIIIIKSREKGETVNDADMKHHQKLEKKKRKNKQKIPAYACL